MKTAIETEEVFRTKNPAVGDKMNNSNLAAADCWARLANPDLAFEGMSNDDLDSIYRIAYDHWAYHLTREEYIKALYQKRKDLVLRDRIGQILRDGITFSSQVNKYVVHGAIDELIKLIREEASKI